VSETMALPFVAGCQTSIDAAVSMESSAPTLREKVLEFIRHMDAHGATDEEMQEALELNPSTQRPRRRELVQRGLVEPSSRKRPTRSGRSATVWIRVG